MAPKKKAAAKKETKAEEEPKSKTAADTKEEPSAAAKAMAKKEEPPAKVAPEKRKAEEKKEEPPKKEAKAVKKEEAAEADALEKEKDAPADKRSVLKETVGFNPSDVTLNVLPTVDGKVLMALSEGGMQYLIAGARANVGVKAGRYMFEVKIVEALNPAESSAGGGRGRAPAPRQLLRVGFSTSSSPLVLGDSEDHVCFDSEGSFCVGKKKTPASQRFTRDQVIAVVLNLDTKSPNANTLSLFREGERISEPQQIPENLQGKTLFPHVSFRNVTVQVLFGQQPAKSLPFKCRQLGGAAQADVTSASKVEPKDGKYEVMLPVAFPDEGTFDWLDTFLTHNPNYVELSDRKILEWAVSSGLWKPKTTGWKTSNDKPEFNFGLPGMDDLSIRRVINAVAPVVPRNYVIMEVKSNLVAAERGEVLRRFSAPHFKKVAHVVMGEPNEEFKQMQLDKLLKEKQEKADIAWRAKKAEEKRKKDIEKRQKQLTEMRKQAEDARKKAAEEAKKKAEEAKKKAEEAKRKAEAKKKAEEAGEEYVEEEEVKEEEIKEETMEVGEAKEEVKEEEEEKKDAEMEEEEEEDTEPPKVELTEEEKKMWFRRPAGGCGDLTSTALNQSFGCFCIPEKSEGFDELRFEWQDAAESKDYLRRWVLDKKRTSRIEDLQPGQWFQERAKEWQKLFAEWQAKQKAFKSSAAQKEKEAAAKKAEEKKEGEEGESKEEELLVEDQTLDVDIMMVDDVCDVGNGEPLFKDFAFEDWALLQLRYELYLLQIAFKKDVNDPERVGVHENHLAFYYNKYFRKQLTPKYFNAATNQEMANLVKDAIGWDVEEKVLTTTLEEELESVNIFIKLTEENRRERQRRIDAGDETARLKFSPLAIQQPTNPKAPGASPSGSIRPAGQSWAGTPAAKAWGSGGGGKGAIYPQTGFRPAGAWGSGGGGPGWGAGRRW